MMPEKVRKRRRSRKTKGSVPGEAVQKVQKLQGKDTGKERSAQGREDGSCKGEEQKGEEIKERNRKKNQNKGQNRKGSQIRKLEEKKTASRKTAWWVRLSDMLLLSLKLLRKLFRIFSTQSVSSVIK